MRFRLYTAKMQNLMRKISIGVLSRRAGVTVEAIRYYEQVGILAPAERKSSGYRLFDCETLRTLRFIKQGQNLGFSLSQIKQLLDFKVNPRSSCKELHQFFAEHLEDLNMKIQELQRMRKAVEEIKSRPCSKRGTKVCKIIQSIEVRESENGEGEDRH